MSIKSKTKINALSNKPIKIKKKRNIILTLINRNRITKIIMMYNNSFTHD